jgi:putative transposase
MIDRAHDLPITKQAKALNISRGSVYYLPRPVSKADLTIMWRLDRLHLEFPFAGSRMLRGLLAAEGCKIGRRHVKTLMRRMGIEALYRRPRTTKPEPGHKIYPYLLRGIEITQPNQVSVMELPTSRWRAASSIWPSCSTGSAVRGAYRSRWRRRSASRRLRTLSPTMASRRSMRSACIVDRRRPQG